jgi:hypothetical protein
LLSASSTKSLDRRGIVREVFGVYSIDPQPLLELIMPVAQSRILVSKKSGRIPLWALVFTATLSSLMLQACGPRNDPSDSTPPQFVEITLTFERVADSLDTGTVIIPPEGYTHGQIARDRRLVVKASAGDGESGVQDIYLTGGYSWTCSDGSIGQSKQGTFRLPTGDSISGNPSLANATVKVDPFEANPLRILCGISETEAPLVVQFKVYVTNGRGMETTSGPIAITYQGRAPSP